MIKQEYENEIQDIIYGCIINPGLELHHDSTIEIYTNSVVRSLTTVGNRVWIGSTATVSTSAVVPDDTTI